MLWELFQVPFGKFFITDIDEIMVYKYVPNTKSWPVPNMIKSGTVPSIKG